MGLLEKLGIKQELTPEEKERKQELILQQRELARKRKEEARLKAEERAKETFVMLDIASGNNQLSVPKRVQMRQKIDGSIYFGFSETLYTFESYEWNGPQYNIVTNSVKTGTHTKKGKAGKIGAGAVIGSAVCLGVGTAVGAAMGAGSKGKTSINENTRSVQQQVEINTPATLRFKNIETGQIVGITIVCNTLIDCELKKFVIRENPQETVITHKIDNNSFNEKAIDPVEEIKKYKELADQRIITQEEFEAKKKQLLNL